MPLMKEQPCGLWDDGNFTLPAVKSRARKGLGTLDEATEDSSEFLCTSQNTILNDKHSELEVNCQRVDKKRLLRTLLNCIQRETELNDSYRLPYYLHQVDAAQVMVTEEGTESPEGFKIDEDEVLDKLLVIKV
eukprot:g32758.t1